MKKKIALLSFATLIFLSSCTEKGSLIDFSSDQRDDTSYLLNVPEATENRRILVEEATGVTCSNCPDATKILETADKANPGRILTIGLHVGKFTEPTDASKFDFRNEDVWKVYTLLGGSVPNKPAAVFDRTLQGTNYFEDARNKWPDIIDQRLKTKTPVRLTLSSRYNSLTREDTLTLRISYTEPVSKAQSLGILVIENNIIDYQTNGIHKDSFYVHSHVLRAYVTPVNGFSFLDSLSTKENGRVYERTIVYKLPDNAFGDARYKWNLGNCYVLGFVFNNESGDKEIVQAIQTKLTD